MGRAILTSSRKQALFLASTWICLSLAAASSSSSSPSSSESSSLIGSAQQAFTLSRPILSTNLQFYSTSRNQGQRDPRIMKTIVYGPNGGNPVWKEQPKPKPRAKPFFGSPQPAVTVLVCAVGLNPVDAKGVIGDKLPHSWTTLQSLARRFCVQSKVIGYDFAGIVVEANDTARHPEKDQRQKRPTFTVGDRVFGIIPPARYDGSLQEFIRVSTEQIAHIPDGRKMSMEQAAALPLVGITAFQCLRGAGWAEAEGSESRPRRLLVLGASGGTGHMAVQVGRCLRPEDAIVAVCSTRNMDFVHRLASNVIVLDYRDKNFVDQLRAAGPFDVVMDCVTSGDPRDQADIDYGKLFLEDSTESLLTSDGQYRRLGGCFSDWFRASVERMTGVQLWQNPRAKLFWIQMHEASDALTRMAKWWENGSMKEGAHVARTVDFTPEGVQAGFDALLGRRMVGKVVVHVADEIDGGDEIKQTNKNNDYTQPEPSSPTKNQS